MGRGYLGRALPGQGPLEFPARVIDKESGLLQFPTPRTMNLRARQYFPRKASPQWWGEVPGGLGGDKPGNLGSCPNSVQLPRHR